MSNKTFLVLIMISVLFSANAVPAMAQSTTTQNLLVNIQLAPSHVDTKNSVLPIGYINLVNAKGIAVKAPVDLLIQLESDDPEIASVPSSVTILKDHNYAKFDVTVGNIDGETNLSSLFNGKINYKIFKVGGTADSLPDDMELVINLPTSNMHVNSEMPFSVFLKSGDNVIRAPYDIVLDIDFEKSLIETDSEQLVIKKGEYYSWGKLKTFENIGNAFLRVSFDRFDIDTAENIEITSSLPAGIAINIFPKKLSALPDRNLDVFVSLIDNEGNPAVTPEDIVVKLFSDEEVVGKKLDETMKEEKVVIKKGEFGYYFREEINLFGLEGKTITIGASIENLGIALDEFTLVESLNIDHPKAENVTLSVFVIDKMPSNTTAILVYQFNAEGWGGDGTELCLELDIECIKQNKKNISSQHPIDALGEDDFYPIQVNENYVSKGSFSKINVVSSDHSIISILDAGSIDSTQSFGTAIIKSGEVVGEVDLAATIKGIGAGVDKTSVVDIFRHTNTEIFSPTGKNVIVLDKNGYFDLFLVALDGKQRPKILDQSSKYILSPVNEVLEIKRDQSFAYANFRSDSFSAGLDEVIDVSAVPIGVESEYALKAESGFGTQLSSIVEVKLPFESLDAESGEPYDGIVQLKDLLDNPNTATRDLRIKLDQANPEIVNIPEHVTIEKGSSYATFPIQPTGEFGDSKISASIKGVIGSETKISTKSNQIALKIFTNGLQTPLEVNKPLKLQVFIDDENAESVAGANIKFVTDSGVATITPSDTRTNADGGVVADLTVHQGPSVSIQIIATADGYAKAEQTFEYDVNASGPSLVLGLPDWVVYVGAAAVLGIVAVLLVFLKKPKPVTEEDEDDYEYEEDI